MHKMFMTNKKHQYNIMFSFYYLTKMGIKSVRATQIIKTESACDTSEMTSVNKKM